VPYVLAGDFNIQPDSSPYQLLTTGELPADHPQQPPARDFDAWRPVVPCPLASAYAQRNGREPEFTNFAVTKFGGNEAFVGTLDYVFLSGGWRTAAVKPLPELQQSLASKSFPSATEPSDHVLIWADLELDLGRPPPGGAGSRSSDADDPAPTGSSA